MPTSTPCDDPLAPPVDFPSELPPLRPSLCARASSALHTYAARFRGTRALKAPPLPARGRTVALATVGSFLGMLALTSLDLGVSARGLEGVVASFGATVVLVFAAPSAPLAQPRNVIGGQTLSAAVGVALRVLLVELPARPDATFAVAALAVALSIAAMMATGTLHPAGSGTAYIAVTSAAAAAQGWLFIVMPCFVASVVIVLCAAMWNNLFEGGDWPAYWLR